MVLVTGGRSSAEVLELFEPVPRSARIVVVNAHRDNPIAVPRIQLINARSLDEFANEWNRLQ